MGRHNSHHFPANSSPERKVGGDAGPIKKKVKEIAEKLKTLAPEERLELKSIQALLSVLELESVSKTIPPSSAIIASIKHFYTILSSLSKKYFSPLLSQKISKSNLYCLFFSFLALIFYFELHTSSGFTRFWLKWEDVDLRSVEVNSRGALLSLLFKNLILDEKLYYIMIQLLSSGRKHTRTQLGIVGTKSTKSLSPTPNFQCIASI